MKLKKIWKILFLLFVVTILSFFIYTGLRNFVYTKKLENLTFQSEAIEVIKGKELEKYIIDNNLYSKILNEAFVEEVFNIDYIDGYIDSEYKENFNNANAINTLYEKKYTVKEITSLFNSLSAEDITILLVRDYEKDLINMLAFDYFYMNSLDEYKAYDEIKDYKLENIITYVNIGLNNDFYTNIKEIEDPNNLLVICNKYNKLPNDFVPKNLERVSDKYASNTRELRKDAREAFESMADNVEKLGMHIEARSGYRSYSVQNTLYNDYVARSGKTKADTYSARAGHSEHQTGLAVDIHDGHFGTFAYTEEYPWVQENAHKYGFIIRYEEGNEFITGYMAESWHLRYVGIDVAKYIYENEITFEEYYVKFVQKK